MSDISELESRISAALDRISKGVDGLAVPVPVPDNSAELEQALEDEKLANAQLEERIKTLNDKQDSRVADLEQQLMDQRTAFEQLDLSLQRLQTANKELRENNAALRAANEKGVGEAHLINTSMKVELESLRAARVSDIAESEAIKSTLDQLLKNGRAG